MMIEGLQNSQMVIEFFNKNFTLLIQISILMLLPVESLALVVLGNCSSLRVTDWSRRGRATLTHESWPLSFPPGEKLWQWSGVGHHCHRAWGGGCPGMGPASSGLRKTGTRLSLFLRKHDAMVWNQQRLGRNALIFFVYFFFPSCPLENVKEERCACVCAVWLPNYLCWGLWLTLCHGDLRLQLAQPPKTWDKVSLGHWDPRIDGMT